MHSLLTIFGSLKARHARATVQPSTICLSSPRCTCAARFRSFGTNPQPLQSASSSPTTYADVYAASLACSCYQSPGVLFERPVVQVVATIFVPLAVIFMSPAGGWHRNAHPVETRLRMIPGSGSSFLSLPGKRFLCQRATFLRLPFSKRRHTSDWMQLLCRLPVHFYFPFDGRCRRRRFCPGVEAVVN